MIPPYRHTRPPGPDEGEADWVFPSAVPLRARDLFPLLPGDLVYRYTTPGHYWENSAGRHGLCVLRGGVCVASTVEAYN